MLRFTIETLTRFFPPAVLPLAAAIFLARAPSDRVPSGQYHFLSREERRIVLPPKPEPFEPREGEELTISPDCEFWLDGKRCEYKYVPPGCDVCEIGVSEGKVVVLKFRSVPKRMPALAPPPRVK